MYNCPTFFLFWECLDDMSYWTKLYRTVADNELHCFTISNLNYTVFVSLALMILFLHAALFDVLSSFRPTFVMSLLHVSFHRRFGRPLLLFPGMYDYS